MNSSTAQLLTTHTSTPLSSLSPSLTSYAASGGGLAGVAHDEQLHDAVVNGAVLRLQGARLYDEHVLASERIIYLNLGF